MARKPRKYLCQGCAYCDGLDTDSGRVQCKAVKTEVEAVPHVKQMRFESCPRRSGLQPGTKRQLFLKELAKQARQLPNPTAQEIAKLEEKLKTQMGIK